MTVQQVPGSPALLLPAVPKAWYALPMLHGDPEGIYKHRGGYIDTEVGLLPMVTKIYVILVSTKMLDSQVPG